MQKLQRMRHRPFGEVVVGFSFLRQWRRLFWTQHIVSAQRQDGGVLDLSKLRLRLPFRLHSLALALPLHQQWYSLLSMRFRLLLRQYQSDLVSVNGYYVVPRTQRFSIFLQLQ